MIDNLEITLSISKTLTFFLTLLSKYRLRISVNRFKLPIDKLNWSKIIEENLFIITIDVFFKFRILKYEKGQSIKDHSDVGGNIRASCTLNLNEDYEGGEFIFFEGQIKEVFKTGDAMLFPAEPIWIHGTEPITKGIRYSINCFLQEWIKKNKM